MDALREQPLKATLLAAALAVAAVLGIALAYDPSAFADAWRHFHLRWLILAGGAGILGAPVYLIAYRAAIRHDGGPRLPLRLALRVVLLGFGPFAPSGGFVVDKRALHTVLGDEDHALIKVLGLSALEWAVLAPLAWACAVALLIAGTAGVMPSLVWPWALAVPAGFAIGLPLAGVERLRRPSDGGRPNALQRALTGVATVRALARRPVCRSAWLGMTLYWVLEIAALYGALRCVSLRPNVAATAVAFATGYALTRRSLPLGGAGLTEVLMTFALHWVGQPVPAALAAVVVYRMFNFVVPIGPALLVRRHVAPLLGGGSEARRLAAARY